MESKQCRHNHWTEWMDVERLAQERDYSRAVAAGHIEKEEFPKHANRTQAVAFGPDGSVFSAGNDGFVRRNFPATAGLTG